jgi:hypothetical protein
MSATNASRRFADYAAVFLPVADMTSAVPNLHPATYAASAYVFSTLGISGLTVMDPSTLTRAVNASAFRLVAAPQTRLVLTNIHPPPTSVFNARTDPFHIIAPGVVLLELRNWGAPWTEEAAAAARNVVLLALQRMGYSVARRSEVVVVAAVAQLTWTQIVDLTNAQGTREVMDEVREAADAIPLTTFQPDLIWVRDAAAVTATMPTAVCPDTSTQASSRRVFCGGRRIRSFGVPVVFSQVGGSAVTTLRLILNRTENSSLRNYTVIYANATTPLTRGSAYARAAAAVGGVVTAAMRGDTAVYNVPEAFPASVQTQEEVEGRGTVVVAQKLCYTAETPIANFFADAIRWGVGADLALLPACAASGTGFGAGVVNASMLWRHYPRGDAICKLQLRGLHVFELLNLTTALATYDLSGESPLAKLFLQISGGAMTVCPTLPSNGAQGSRLLSLSVGGAPLERLRLYTVATTEPLCRWLSSEVAAMLQPKYTGEAMQISYAGTDTVPQVAQRYAVSKGGVVAVTDPATSRIVIDWASTAGMSWVQTPASCNSKQRFDESIGTCVAGDTSTLTTQALVAVLVCALLLLALGAIAARLCLIKETLNVLVAENDVREFLLATLLRLAVTGVCAVATARLAELRHELDASGRGGLYHAFIVSTAVTGILQVAEMAVGSYQLSLRLSDAGLSVRDIAKWRRLTYRMSVLGAFVIDVPTIVLGTYAAADVSSDIRFVAMLGVAYFELGLKFFDGRRTIIAVVDAVTEYVEDEQQLSEVEMATFFATFDRYQQQAVAVHEQDVLQAYGFTAPGLGPSSRLQGKSSHGTGGRRSLPLRHPLAVGPGSGVSKGPLHGAVVFPDVRQVFRAYHSAMAAWELARAAAAAAAASSSPSMTHGSSADGIGPHAALTSSELPSRSTPRIGNGSAAGDKSTLGSGRGTSVSAFNVDSRGLVSLLPAVGSDSLVTTDAPTGELGLHGSMTTLGGPLSSTNDERETRRGRREVPRRLTDDEATLQALGMQPGVAQLIAAGIPRQKRDKIAGLVKQFLVELTALGVAPAEYFYVVQPFLRTSFGIPLIGTPGVSTGTATVQVSTGSTHSSFHDR